ncbi:MAG: hypothetical protein Q4G47_01030 [Lachnospiraceae bacterium]|nr:hypothetical protein [Lachnospiraceae bacterium]
MRKTPKRLAARIMQLMLLMIVIAGFSVTAHASRQQVSPAYGYYKIVAVNGHVSGSV